METFNSLKPFADNPGYARQRQSGIQSLNLKMIDNPVVPVIKILSGMSFCFTLQSCFGHFVYQGQTDTHNLESLPGDQENVNVEYRISYLALCLENNDAGHKLHDLFRDFVQLDPAYIQWGCAQWFWKQQVNSYAIQIEPDRFKHKDSCLIPIEEARYIENLKKQFWIDLEKKLLAVFK